MSCVIFVVFWIWSVSVGGVLCVSGSFLGFKYFG